MKTIGIVAVAALAASAAGRRRRNDHGHLPANQFRRHRRQPIILTLRPAVFDRHVLALDDSRFRPDRGGTRPRRCARLGRPPLRKPITGIAGCCARAASGHAAAPPSSVMNSRRFMRPLHAKWRHTATTGHVVRHNKADPPMSQMGHGRSKSIVRVGWSSLLIREQS